MLVYHSKHVSHLYDKRGVHAGMRKTDNLYNKERERRSFSVECALVELLVLVYFDFTRILKQCFTDFVLKLSELSSVTANSTERGPVSGV